MPANTLIRESKHQESASRESRGDEEMESRPPQTSCPDHTASIVDMGEVDSNSESDSYSVVLSTSAGTQTSTTCYQNAHKLRLDQN